MDNSKILPWIVVAILIIVVFYFMQQKNQATTQANQQIAQLAVEPCVPFTKAQQDEQKKELNKSCAKLQFTPIIGQFQFLKCIGEVDKKLTPIKTCN